MKPYKLSSQAAKDIADIAAYIARDKAQAAAKFVVELAEAFVLISSMPEMGRKNKELHPLYRFFPHGQYLIVYNPKTKPLTIARVLSGMRNIHALINDDPFQH